MFILCVFNGNMKRAAFLSFKWVVQALNAWESRNRSNFSNSGQIKRRRKFWGWLKSKQTNIQRCFILLNRAGTLKSEGRWVLPNFNGWGFCLDGLFYHKHFCLKKNLFPCALHSRGGILCTAHTQWMEPNSPMETTLRKGRNITYSVPSGYFCLCDLDLKLSFLISY